MDGDDHDTAVGELMFATAAGGDRWRLPGQAPQPRRAESYYHFGMNELTLQIEPPAANVDLAIVGPLVQPALAARLVLEVLDRVGDVEFAPFKLCSGQSAIQ